MSYQELHDDYMRQLGKVMGEFSSDENKLYLDFEEYVNLPQLANKAFVLLEIESGNYVKWHKIEEKFGYKNEEFTAEAVNNCKTNFKELMLIHPDQIEHKSRYSTIVIEILKSQTQFKVREDSYSVKFKLKHKEGYYVPVRRKSIIFHATETLILTRLDEWTIVGEDDAEYVSSKILTTNKEKTDELNKSFYEKNLNRVIKNLFKKKKDQLSSQLIQIFYYKLEHDTLSNKEIAAKLNLTEGAVEKAFYEISEKLRDKFDFEGQGVPIVRRIARIWGLFPLP